MLRLIDRISEWASYLAAFLVLCLIFTMCLEVVSRYVFNAPTSWAFEIAYMGLGAIFVFSIGEALRTEVHVRVDFLYSRFSERTRAIVNAAGFALLLLPGCWWISVSLLRYAFHTYQAGMTTAQSAWNPVVWPFRFAIAIGFTLFTIQASVELARNLQRLVWGRSGDE